MLFKIITTNTAVVVIPFKNPTSSGSGNIQSTCIININDIKLVIGQLSDYISVLCSTQETKNREENNNSLSKFPKVIYEKINDNGYKINSLNNVLDNNSIADIIIHYATVQTTRS